MDIFGQKLAASVFIVGFAVLTLIFLSRYKKKSKLKTIFVYIASVLLLVIQNIIFVVPMLGKYFFNEYIILFILMVTICSSFILAYYFIVRNRDKEWSKFSEAVFAFSVVCYAISLGLVVSSQMAVEVGDVTSYEVIGEDTIVISEYDGLLLVMECTFEEDNKLNINKGNYRFIQKEDVEIEYKTFNAVICEEWENAKLVE